VDNPTLVLAETVVSATVFLAHHALSCKGNLFIVEKKSQFPTTYDSSLYYFFLVKIIPQKDNI